MESVLLLLAIIIAEYLLNLKMGFITLVESVIMVIVVLKAISMNRSNKVFYHVYIPPDLRAWSWQYVIDEQLSCIRRSRLHVSSRIMMFVTMPLYWPDAGFLPFKRDGDSADILFKDKVWEYVSSRYPFVEIVDMRDCQQPNLYEASTLSAIKQLTTPSDCVLYIHNKGIVSNSTHTTAWRQVLNHFMIERWTLCMSMLNRHDVVGVRDKPTAISGNTITSGNFWWTTGEYINTLPDPLDVTYERWILSSLNANVGYVYDTTIDHSLDYLFLENIKEKI